jgi:predicted Rossmann fold nucleotide-binding protein DprA/Smf involved in DNA uptake
MTTAKRVWYEGAAYHITARGNHRNDIFRDDEDFQYYLKVIEEALLYTATCGLKYNKEVYAVPGTIYDKYSKGTNMLISNGAKIYLSPNNILTEHNSDKIEYKQNSCTSLKGEGLILSSLNKGPMSLDEIKLMMGLAGEKIEELLIKITFLVM